MVANECSRVLNLVMVNGSPQISASSSGTITFEQPVGSTPVARPCGPS
jgi:hypothetical protein